MLLRHSARAFLRRAATFRAAEAESPAATVVPDEFKAEWKKVAPNMDSPNFLSKFLAERPAVPAAIPEKLTVNFNLPHEVPYQAKEVDMVIIPSTSGQMGVLPGHVPTVAQLKPGIMSVHEGTDVKTYFVSSGFAFIHPNSVADICAVEAVPLEDLDPEAVKAGVATYAQKLATATTELEQAEAQIGVEVHSAMSAALGL
eukprot:TRINITY_DN22866_c0_g1_i1.p1 TRINITY_DN22866_c0_g1~~TRINITY_DN22866_c0_g1_i1.p1  ORF type:complete len:200 (-),score=47.10 TRINITY_DN22866_c0_g1_i1:913-1512(-)